MGLYDTTIGPLLVGVFFNTFLYGLVAYQFAVYYRTKFNDPLVTKFMVLFLFLLDTFHSGSAIYMIWSYTVTNYNNPTALQVADWPHTITPLATALAALVTHVYLGFRIWCLTGSKILYGVVLLLAIPPFILGTTCTIKACIIKFFSGMPSFTPLVVAWLSMQVVVDTFITTTMVIVLSRSRTGLSSTDSIVNRFIRCAIQTGLFSGIFAVCDLVSFAVLPNMGLYGMFGVPLGRIYTNTLLDTLLTRERLQVKKVGVASWTRSIMIDSVYWQPNDSQALAA